MCVMAGNDNEFVDKWEEPPESPRRDERSIFQTIIGKDREEANREYDAAKESASNTRMENLREAELQQRERDVGLR